MNEAEFAEFLKEAEPHLERIEVVAAKPPEVITHASDEIVDVLIRRLRDDGDIDFPDPATLAWGMGQQQVTHEALTRQFITWADHDSVESAIAKLRLLRGNVATEIAVALMSGITAATPIRIDATTTICSFASIPASRSKLLAIDLLKGPLPTIEENRFACVKRSFVRQPLFGRNAVNERDSLGWHFEEMNDIARVLAMVRRRK